MGQQNSYLTAIVVHSTMHLMHHNHCQITIMYISSKHMHKCVCHRRKHSYFQLTTLLERLRNTILILLKYLEPSSRVVNMMYNTFPKFGRAIFLYIPRHERSPIQL